MTFVNDILIGEISFLVVLSICTPFILMAFFQLYLSWLPKFQINIGRLLEVYI